MVICYAKLEYIYIDLWVYLLPSLALSFLEVHWLKFSQFSFNLVQQEEKEESERRQKEKLEREAEQERLHREAKEREEEKKRKELEEIKRKKAQDRLDAMKKTTVGARALHNVTVDVRRIFTNLFINFHQQFVFCFTGSRGNESR